MALKSTHTVRSRNEAQVLVVNVATFLKLYKAETEVQHHAKRTEE